MRQWFALKSKPKREEQVCSVLVGRGIEVYLPLVPSRRSLSQNKTALEPLFPGYLFSRFALGTAEWVAARSAPGVSYFLGAEGTPSALPDSLVEEIRQRASETCQRGWEPDFKHGDRVVIRSGPFAGMEAVFDTSLSPKWRVRVFLGVVSRLVPVDLDAGTLSRAV